MNSLRKKLIIVLAVVTTIEAQAQWTESGSNLYPNNYNTAFVGIGTNAPAEKLHINGSIRGNISGGALRISTTNGYVDVGPANPSWSHFSTDRSKFYFNKPIYIDGAISSYYTLDLDFQTNGTQRMKIANSSGYVGIGINQPAHPLDVNGTIRSSSYFRTTNVSMGHGYIADDGAGSTIFSITRQLNNETRFHSNGFHSFYSGGNTGVERMRIDANGNVGIGTNLPGSKLVIISGGQSVKFLTGTNTSSYTLEMGVNDNGVNISNNSAIRGFNFTNATGNLFTITSNGNVGIGTTDPDTKLTVKGVIHTNEVRVDMNPPIQGPDYVFEKDYDLLSLTELETYINQNKHLPEVPSAKEMEENGLNLKEMNLLLLKKVEELTLYLIEQNNRINNLEKENTTLKSLITNKK